MKNSSSILRGVLIGWGRVLAIRLKYGFSAPIITISRIQDDMNFSDETKKIMIKAYVEDANYEAEKKEKEVNNQEEAEKNEGKEVEK